MKQYNCGLCEKSFATINDAANCEDSCLALEEQYRSYYCSEQQEQHIVTNSKPTVIVIEMANDVVVRITGG